MENEPKYDPPKKTSKATGFLIVLVGLIVIDGALSFHHAGVTRWLLLAIGLAVIVLAVAWFRPKR